MTDDDGQRVYLLPGPIAVDGVTVVDLAGAVDLGGFITDDGITFGPAFDDQQAAAEPIWSASERSVTMPVHLAQPQPGDIVDVFPTDGGYFVIRWSRPESWLDRARRLRRIRVLRRAYDGPRRTRRRRRRA